MATKTIVVLANSSKKGGRSLAGKEVRMTGGIVEDFGAWIRPISPGHVEVAGKSEGGQVTVDEMKRALNRAPLPAILEILEIPFSRAASLPDQPENWEVAAGQPWRSLGMLSNGTPAEDGGHPTTLWDTSGRGWAKVDESFPKEPGFASLYLIAPKGECFAEVGSRRMASGSAQQVLYRNLNIPYGGMTHEFRISDPAFDAAHSAQFPTVGAATKVFTMPRGTYGTVSLTPAYSPSGQPPRFHYKMAAAIIKPNST